MPNDFEAENHSHQHTQINRAMDDDLDRIRCENELQRAMRRGNYDDIVEWIEKCNRFRKNPATFELITDAYDRLIELKPADAVKITNEKYKSLPFMGMKRYIKRVCNFLLHCKLTFCLVERSEC